MMKKITLLLIGVMGLLQVSQAQKFLNTEVTFKSPDGKITYGGTLSLPEGNKKYPAVVMVSGTGRQDRDGLMAGHKIFLDVANALATNGYAVLRLDDRGVGATTGVYETATTADFAKDALLAVQYLKGVKQINTKKIGLIGHSEGGAAMAIAAAENKDVSFLISLSGIAMNGFDALVSQNEKIIAESKLPDYDKARSNEINKLMFETALKYADSANMEAKLNETYTTWKVKDDAYFKTLKIEFDHFRFPVYSYVNYAIGPWYRYFIKYDAQRTLAKIKVPVLAINGDKDYYVVASNLDNWKNYITAGGNTKVETHLLKDVNHLLLPCQTCDQAELPNIKSSVSPEAINIIITWLKKTIK
ncbi:alpha/beta hydrolase family protein [Pedobacter sp. CFBP9032]|uniref:alpha/beta hydrolase family protein n=1 Tax=Pedobacter sp. CFBP9032 TaxID=3096539 RepID=UPI002A6A11DB|nr:alpha/beta fold hydrolase [Pedobacter sp. CFBP9032]MDY0903292.1 alpha/beta fold hydrolase [Pedobacter sp. CFBP9032]